MALDILHQRHLHHLLVVDGAYIGRDGFESRYLRGTPAALACNNLEPVFCHLTERDGLYDTDFPDTGGQFLQRFFVKIVARLTGIRLYLFDGDLVDGRRATRLHGLSGYQRVETSAQRVALGIGAKFLMYGHIS